MSNFRNVSELADDLMEDAQHPINDDGDVITDDSTLIEAAHALRALVK